MALHIKTDGTETTVQPADGKRFTLAELQGYVGGLIEIVKTHDKRTMYVNEEGLVDNLPRNAKASGLIDSCYLTIDGVRGDVLVLDKGKRVS